MRIQRPRWTATIAVLVAALLCDYGIARDADFGKQWVRSHPFTLGALAQTPAIVDGEEYNAAFNTFLAWKRPDGLLPIAVDQQMPWHFHVNQETLTSDVMAQISNMHATYAGNTGWLVRDEPSRIHMDGVAQVADWLKQQTPNSLVYTNLFPIGGGAGDYYGDSSNPSYDYRNYLEDTMSIVRPDVLMYDLYPFGMGGLGHTGFYYTNMMVVRSVAQANDVPYWAFIQAYEEPASPDKRLSSESDLRFQMFSLMTAGYTGFHYFAYDGVGSRAVMDHSGNPTPLYDIAVQVNAEVLTLGNTLRFLESTDVRYIPNVGNDTPPLLQSWSLGAGGDTVINHVAVDTNPAFGNSIGEWKDGLIGFFTDDDGEKYFMITNAYHGDGLSSADTLLHFEIGLNPSVNHVLRLNPLTGLAETVYPDAFNILRLTIPGGSGMLFKYDTGVGFPVPEPSSAALLLLMIATGLRRRRN